MATPRALRHAARMFSGLKIGNFKAFGAAQEIPLRPLTLVFGPNSAGKSSIIQSLLLARHIQDTGNVDAHQTTLGGAAVDLGGFRQYARNHESTIETVIQFSIPRSAITAKLEYDFKALEVAYGIRRGHSTEGRPTTTIASVTLHFDGNELVQLESSESGELRVNMSAINSTQWGNRYCRLFEKRADVVLELSQMRYAAAFLALENRSPLSDEYPDYEIFGSDAVFDHPGRGAFGYYEREIMRENDGQESDSSKVWARVFRYHLECVIGGANRAIREALSALSYLGPLRWIPPRFIPEGEQFDASWKAGGGDAWQRLRREPELLERVNHFLRDVLRSRYRLECQRFALLKPGAASAGNAPAASDSARVSEDSPQSAAPHAPGADETITALSIVDAESGLTVSHRDVGTGISQLLPVLVNAAGSKERLIMIEQPELHLHPALQAELGDVFIESAKENGNKFLIETHSEHLILRLLRRIRETAAGELPPGAIALRREDVAVLYVKPGAEGSEVIELPVNEEGDFDRPWPDGFFPERARELF